MLGEPRLCVGCERMRLVVAAALCMAFLQLGSEALSRMTAVVLLHFRTTTLCWQSLQQLGRDLLTQHPRKPHSSLAPRPRQPSCTPSVQNNRMMPATRVNLFQRLSTPCIQLCQLPLPVKSPYGPPTRVLLGWAWSSPYVLPAGGKVSHI